MNNINNINNINNKNDNDLVLKNCKKNNYCLNCGKYGHTNKICFEPITSYGIILFKRFNFNINNNINNINNNTNNSNNIKNIDNYLDDKLDNKFIIKHNCNKNIETIKYLLIRRKDSLNYIEFLRGKYDINNLKFINIMFTEMTIDERNKIKDNDFDLLWNDLWNNKKKNKKNNYDEAKKQFYLFKNGYNIGNLFINLDIILNSTESVYKYPEWGFPKGKRNNREKNLTTALREFYEETAIKLPNIKVINQLNTLDEVFKASNDVKYKHTYFIANTNNDIKPIIESDNKVQKREIGDIGWFSYNECLNLFRDYDKSKISILTKLNNILTNFNFKEEYKEYKENK